MKKISIERAKFLQAEFKQALAELNAHVRVLSREGLVVELDLHSPSERVGGGIVWLTDAVSAKVFVSPEQLDHDEEFRE